MLFFLIAPKEFSLTHPFITYISSTVLIGPRVSAWHSRPVTNLPCHAELVPTSAEASARIAGPVKTLKSIRPQWICHTAIYSLRPLIITPQIAQATQGRIPNCVLWLGRCGGLRPVAELVLNPQVFS